VSRSTLGRLLFPLIVLWATFAYLVNLVRWLTGRGGPPRWELPGSGTGE
jgi:hypothetical protein